MLNILKMRVKIQKSNRKLVSGHGNYKHRMSFSFQNWLFGDLIHPSSKLSAYSTITTLQSILLICMQNIHMLCIAVIIIIAANFEDEWIKSIRRQFWKLNKIKHDILWLGLPCSETSFLVDFCTLTLILNMLNIFT